MTTEYNSENKNKENNCKDVKNSMKNTNKDSYENSTKDSYKPSTEINSKNKKEQ